MNVCSIERHFELEEAYKEASDIAKKWISKSQELEAENKRLREALDRIVDAKTADETYCGDDCANKLVAIAEEALNEKK